MTNQHSKQGGQKIKDVKSRIPREVLLQYPTYTIWKKAFEATLDEAEKYPVLAERWGNSYEGYTINILKEGIII